MSELFSDELRERSADDEGAVHRKTVEWLRQQLPDLKRQLRRAADGGSRYGFFYPKGEDMPYGLRLEAAMKVLAKELGLGLDHMSVGDDGLYFRFTW